MKKSHRFILVICILLVVFSGCSKPSTNAASETSKTIVEKKSSFSVCFIDVGQGDSALIECDGKYMLIDGGDKAAGDKVHDVLSNKGVNQLEILAISHYHQDHIGGLQKALIGISKIQKTISNRPYWDKNNDYLYLDDYLTQFGSKIDIPSIGDIFNLGSATIEVLDVSDAEPNDSLVLMITYGDTKFLFTGDIEEKAEKRIIDLYANEDDEPYAIDVIKMPHHGSWQNQNLVRLFWVFDPEYAVISVGDYNTYGHPHQETMVLLAQAGTKVYQTNTDGDITFTSDGKSITVETSK